MFDNILDNLYEELKDSFEQLIRFYFILVIHIRTYLRTGIYVTDDMDFTPLEAMDYRMFCVKIEEIGKILKDLRLNDNIKGYFLEIKQYFVDVMNAYLKKNLMSAHQAWFGKEEVLKRANSRIKTQDINDKEKIKDIMRIAENCKDMAAFI